MNPKTILTLTLAVLLALVLGYWLGSRKLAEHAATAPVTSTERVPLYYRNPMGQPDTSPVPKKDSMGMDYIPVYADELDDAGLVKVSPGRMQTLGVRTQAVRRQVLEQALQVAGRIDVDERRRQIVTTRFDGYIERLHVDATGQTVQRGQPLFSFYSPELATAQQEYLLARRGLEAADPADAISQRGLQALVEASLARLRNWDISPDQIEALARSGAGPRTWVVRAPQAGIVSEKTAVQGMRFAPGDALYTLTDLSQVWLIAQVFETDLDQLALGQDAQVSVDAFPTETFPGRISYIYPTLDTDTRSVPVRIELANLDGRLKPGLFARASLAPTEQAPVLVVSDTAILDDGNGHTVLVEQGEGRFEPRSVEIGRRAGPQVEIIQGLTEGEQVVVAANFLIDADIRMQAAVAGFASPAGATDHEHDHTHDTHDHHASPTLDPALPRHSAEGRVESIDRQQHSLMLTHGPVPSLGWPAMTMPFALAEPDLADGLKPGQAIHFEFVEPGPGRWIITTIHHLDAAVLDFERADPGPADHGHHDHAH